MKKFLRFMPVALFAAAAFALTSCSNDENDETDDSSSSNGTPSTENVFSSDFPSQIDGATLTRNSNGQLTSIKENNTTISFEYGNFTPSRANSFTVKMTITDTDYPEDDTTIYMELNNLGFVSYAYEVYSDEDDEPDEWSFDYDTNGYLVKMTRSEGDESYTISYSGGNITKVVAVEEDGDRDEYTISYTNNTVSTPVENKGCIMLYDDTFGVDLDEMEFAYYAGLLGNATKNLPMSATRLSTQGHSTFTADYYYNWEFNSNGLPISFINGDDAWDKITFSW